jgi:hypothetical protein
LAMLTLEGEKRAEAVFSLIAPGFDQHPPS